MSEFQLLKKLVLDGMELTYGKLTLCDLSHYSKYRGDRKWQIYCNDKRNPCYLVFKDVAEAIYKFLELKIKISAKVR